MTTKVKTIAVLAGLAVVAVVVVTIIAATGGSIPGGSAAGGCWYTTDKGTDPGSLALHLPSCTGSGASVARTVFVNTGGFVAGTEPLNAKLVCTMNIGGWDGVWADGDRVNAVTAARDLCQLDINEHGQVQWAN